MAEAEVDTGLFEEFMKEMEQVRENWSQAHMEVETLSFTGESTQGLISVTLNGKFVAQEVHFEQAIRSGVGIRGLEAGVKEAINDAAKKAELYFQAQIEDAVKKMETSNREPSAIPAAPVIKPRLSNPVSSMTN
jgi:DNA-binding YbaB/EbfC family protein